jgi:hypothetical protein
MKARWIKFLAMVAIAAVALGVPAKADAPTMTIVSPTGTIFVTGPGAVVPLMLTAQHNPLSVLTQFDVQVDGVSIIGGQLNPFTGGVTPNLCTAALSAVSTSCATNGLDQAAVTVNWTVQTVPSSYTLFVKSRHQSVTGTDEEEVLVQVLDVEYPAPPAVANAFINSQSSAIRKQFSSAVRGCVISQIAELHAKQEAYGPKGGPYDVPHIQSDVRAFSGSCGGPTIP